MTSNQQPATSNQQPATSHQAPLDRDRLSVLTGTLILALALGRLLDISGQMIEVNIFGSPVGFELTSFATSVAIMGMFIAGIETLVRAHPLARQGQLHYSLIHWVVPGLLGLSLAIWLNRLDEIGLWTLALIGCCLLIPLALSAEYVSVDPQQRQGSWLIWGQMVLIYLVALIFFVVIFDARLRGLISGTGVFLAGGLLATRLLWGDSFDMRQALLYGIAVGAVLGQLTWLLNYSQLSGLQGGLLLLLVFYFLVGLIQQFLAGRFSGRVAGEYGGIAFIGLLVILLLVN